MSNKIEKFLNDNFGEVRCVKIDENIWFVAKDVADALNYSETNAMTKKIDDEEITKIASDKLEGTNSMAREFTLISEAGLYQAVMTITKKDINRYNKAKEFKRWVTREILPTIRKTGAFFEDGREEEAISKYFPSFSEEVKLAMVEDLLKTNKELKPKAEKFEQFLETDGTYTFTSVSKIISTKASEDGLDLPPISVQKLTKLLRDNNILSKNKQGKSYSNTPRKGYVEYFNVTPVTHNQHGEEFTNPKLQTRVKPCGIDFIYELVKNNIA